MPRSRALLAVLAVASFLAGPRAALAASICPPTVVVATPPDIGVVSMVGIHPNDIWVGSGGGPSDTAHWDGAAWTTITTPDVPGTVLYGIGASSSTDVWAVGTVFNTTTVADHWDGTSWTQTPTPMVARYQEFQDVAVISPRNAWAVGLASNDAFTTSAPLIEHWDGTTWRSLPAPKPGLQNTLYAVAAISATDIWAVGEYSTDGYQTIEVLLEHYDGHMWAQVAGQNPATTNVASSVAAISLDDVWIVGSQYRVGSAYQALAEHWDGTVWTVVLTPTVPTEERTLLAVSAIAPGDVWAAGERNNSTFLEHWDGSAWTDVTSQDPGIVSYYTAMTALPDGSVWAAGQYQSGPFSYGLAERTCESNVRDTGFADTVLRGPQGGTFSWRFDRANTQSHSVSGLLFDSGLRPAGDSFSATVPYSGGYPVVDDTTGSTQIVLVPPTAQPKAGGVTQTFEITWSSAAPPPGTVFDVQIKRPGSTTFVDWMTNTTLMSTTFAPDVGVGVYSFQARVRTATGASLYSPAAAISVSST